MKKNKVKTALSVLLGAAGGYALYYWVVMEIIARWCTTGALYVILSVLCLSMCVIGLSALIYLLLSGRIKKQVLWLLIAAYFGALAIILFGRSALGGVFEWNPLAGILDLADAEMRWQSILNFAAFLPMGYFFRKLNAKQTLLWSVALSVALELLQALTMRGMFDTFDIILYVLGINLGAIVFRKWKFEVV